MKTSIKLFIISILLSNQANAQLHLNSNGDASFGTTSKNGKLYVYYSTAATHGNAIFGYSRTLPSSYRYGVKGYAINSSAQTGRAYGVYGLAGNSTNGWNYGVYGSLYGSQYGAAIYGTNKDNPDSYIDGRYAAYFNGAVGVKAYNSAAYTDCFKIDVNSLTTRCYVVKNGGHKFFVEGDGDVYHYGLNYMSDSTEKEEIVDLENSLEKVMKLRGVAYRYKRNIIQNQDGNNSVSDTGTYQRTSVFEEGANIPPKLDKQLKKEEKRKKIGLIAQEVEPVVPEVVRSRFDGKKTIDYTSLVGLLVEAIQELNNEVELLKSNQNSDLKSSKQNTYNDNGMDANLSKNKPNPFNEQTVIDFYLPQSVNNATMNIYDLQGKQIKSIGIIQRGNGSITISANELQPGMYKYALIADGGIFGIETMILTK